MTVNVKIVIMQYLWCYVLGFFFLGGGGGIGCYWIFIKATSVLLPQVQAVWPLDCLTGGHCDPHLKFLSGALKPVVRQENLHYVGTEQRMHETLMTSKYSPPPPPLSLLFFLLINKGYPCYWLVRNRTCQCVPARACVCVSSCVRVCVSRLDSSSHEGQCVINNALLRTALSYAGEVLFH